MQCRQVRIKGAATQSRSVKFAVHSVQKEPIDGTHLRLQTKSQHGLRELQKWSILDGKTIRTKQKLTKT